MPNSSVYAAADELKNKTGLVSSGGAPIAILARGLVNKNHDVVFATDPVNVQDGVSLQSSIAPVTAKVSVSVAQIQALGAVTSGNVKVASLPANSVVVFTTLKPTTALVGGRAAGTLTSDATAPSDAETVTIDTKVYTFKTALTPTEGQVLIGGSAANALINLKKAINQTGVQGTDYQVAAVHPTVTAGTITATTLVVNAKVAGAGANTIATTETSAHLSFGGATLTGGDSAVSAATGRIITTNNNYGTAFDIKQAVGNTVLDVMTTAPKGESFAAATDVNVAIALTGGNAADVTAGAVDAYITYFTRP